MNQAFEALLQKHPEHQGAITALERELTALRIEAPAALIETDAFSARVPEIPDSLYKQLLIELVGLNELDLHLKWVCPNDEATLAEGTRLAQLPLNDHCAECGKEIDFNVANVFVDFTFAPRKDESPNAAEMPGPG